MLSWSVLLIPLAVLAVVLLLPFAGCGLDETGGLEAPATVETQNVSITLSWSGPANQIRSISFKATVQKLPNGPFFTVTSVSPAAFQPSYLQAMAETSVATAIVDTPLVGNYTVTATVSVTQGPWNGGGVTHFLDPVSKTFLADSKWEFSLNLVDQEWKLT